MCGTLYEGREVKEMKGYRSGDSESDVGWRTFGTVFSVTVNMHGMHGQDAGLG